MPQQYYIPMLWCLSLKISLLCVMHARYLWQFIRRECDRVRHRGTISLNETETHLRIRVHANRFKSKWLVSDVVLEAMWRIVWWNNREKKQQEPNRLYINLKIRVINQTCPLSDPRIIFFFARNSFDFALSQHLKCCIRQNKHANMRNIVGPVIFIHCCHKIFLLKSGSH